ncbi:MAG: hypothetical protein RIT45_2746 [Pseudomonadota bacterium]
MVEASAPKPLIAITASVVWTLASMASLLPILFSPMMFDAPGSENNVWLNLSFYSLLSFPVLSVLAVAGSWVVWSKTQHWPAQRASRGRWIQVGVGLLPMISVLLFSLGFLMIEVLCDGSFGCNT